MRFREGCEPYFLWEIGQGQNPAHRLRRNLECQEAIWAIPHRLCRMIWKILHDWVRCEEREPEVSKKSEKRRTAKMVRALREPGYTVEPKALQADAASG